MSSTNGHAHVAAEMREPLRPLRAAELSGTERNALVDSLVEAVNNHAKVLSEHRRAMDAMRERVDELESGARDRRTWALATNARLDAHAGVVLRTSLLARLRWLLIGS